MDVFDVGGCEVNTEEVDTIGLGCALEDFKEFEEVQNLICRLTDVYDNQTLSEATYQRFVYILNQYQEQPHLLDSNLQLLLEHLLSLSRNVNNDKKLQHLAFRFLYIITKVRGFKIVLRHLPHEVTDVEPVLTLLSEQDSQDCNTWETRYMLLLWMSIVVIIPFHMARLDNVNDDSCSKKKTVMERILDVIKLYLSVCDKARDAAAFLASRFITRPDVKPLYLAEYLDWSLKMLVDSDANTMIGLNLQAGVLSSLALLFKHGKRDDFIEYGAPVLKKILECGFKDSKSTTVRKMALKLIQRIGLSFLRVKVATWRYSRGTRSLADNLAQNETSCQIPIKDDSSESDADGYDIPDETEDVIEQLLVGLHDKDTVIRWSAAKGIGRVTARLPKELADDVVTSVLELFSLRESDSAWHGGCLALAELGRRGLILPQHLGKVVCVVLKALVYDELRGNFSVGAHIRDAACYVCWSFARAYEPNVLQPYVNKIAGALLITAVFDREVNCRRAASAAFQENVGRQGTFPHGIEILTTADYYAVVSRHNAFLNLSVYIGQFSEYTAAVINHLLEYKINHWDCAIRELAAKALHNLTASDPQFMSNKALPQLLSQTTGMDLNSRHGAILSVAEIVHALSNLAKNEQNIEESIDNITLEAIRDIVLKLNERKMFRGLGGIFMRTAVCLLIEKASLAGLPFHNDEELVGQWQEIIDSCLQHMEITVRLAAVSALPHFCTQYYPAESSHCLKLLNSYLLQLEANQMEIRCGYALAIGSLPSYILNGHVFRVLQALSECSKLTQDHSSWAEARRDAIKALSQMTITMGVDPCGKSDTVICKANMDALYECLLAAMDDYTLDSRGDVGAIVREAAMSAIQDVTQLIIKKDSTMISEELSSKIFCALLQQCVEKIDRTRAVAGSTFVALLYSIPEIPNVPHRKQLQEIFPMDVCKQINWASPADTFHYFVKLLYLPTYNYNLLLGFTVSVGGLTESLVKFSRVALVNYLTSINTDPDQLTSICNVLVTILKNNLHNDRIVVPFLKMADHLFVSGVKFLDINEKTTFPEQLLDLSWQASFKSSDPQKLLAAVDLFCDLLQFHGSCQKRALSRLTIFLCHRFPRVRKVTASKFYEAVISYDILSDDVLDEVISILSETDWDAPVDSLRPIRNNLCEFFGVPPPRLKSK